MIELKNIIKDFPISDGGHLRVLNDISLSIQKQEILGIIGRSGAGKSTLVRCINLLEPPSFGHVFIDGEELTNSSASHVRKLRQKMGMVFQHFNLLWNRSVEKNIQLPLEVSHIPKAEWKSRIAKSLELVGLSDQALKYPSQLSGGQKQRVGIARALVLEPEFLLCDEITSALDPETTDSILKLLADINQKTGITIVLITHEMEVIQKICHRAIVLDEGKIAEQGKVFDLFSNPQHHTTRRFIRSIFEHDLPKDLQSLLKEAQAKNEYILRLVYTGNKANDATLSQLIRHFDIDVNILHGRIEYIQNEPLGLLWVQLAPKQTSLEQITSFLENADVRVEVISDA
ncbi:MAG: methionine ABC transporter ATP-binding protein [Alphaproteobacteria bacterium]